ncbi:hypothetical protein NDU88_002081 [Pleurodeles waltl]|uniref:Uncharacterized protein n=1 Tax=Pleurodeles waltl TaxID=8319 RepID=A0AAV7SBH0_PLEWA|nr:hypothetical protein NDU88_002081 [Pleurodeles waltl]
MLELHIDVPFKQLKWHILPWGGRGLPGQDGGRVKRQLRLGLTLILLKLIPPGDWKRGSHWGEPRTQQGGDRANLLNRARPRATKAVRPQLKDEARVCRAAHIRRQRPDADPRERGKCREATGASLEDGRESPRYRGPRAPLVNRSTTTLIKK